MISILIPVYNDNVVELVETLQGQCMALKLPFEIICLDDGSQERYRKGNSCLNNLEDVRYVELAENIGRSRIRNRLADMARYPYLLFMDGDSKVIKMDFLANYLQVMKPKRVLYGGRVYNEKPPRGKNYFLHWHYGRRREAVAAAVRKTDPYRTFMTNNFVIPKAIALQIRFNESIRRYGYEDTLYAMELKKAAIPIVHLDNPLEHLGLEERSVFLQKVEDALDNLLEIVPAHPEIDTRLLQMVRQLKERRVLWGVTWSVSWWLPLMKKTLLGLNRPPLWILDLYKLGYFVKESGRSISSEYDR